ncbi:MAG: site-specific integrase [Eubacterium sp.]|nr:site-specific integrase [Eubacterium sp.]
MPAYKDIKTGKWFAKFYYRDWQGKNKQKWKRGFSTKRDALAFEKEFLENLSENTDMTFQTLYEIYFNDMSARLKESTMETKKHIFDTKLIPFFGKMPINKITAADVRRWQSELMHSNEHYSQTYLKQVNNQLVAIMNYAHRFFDLNTDPCGKAGSIGKNRAEEMEYWTLDEYMIFREGIRDKTTAYMCFEVLFWTGIREGELLALTPEDIHFGEKCIDINKTYQRLNSKDIISSPKTAKSRRRVPIPDFLCNELEKYLASIQITDENRRIFPYTKYFLKHEMQRGCDKTGVKRIRIHDIRHSHASLLINQGCDALILADRLGHEKVSTTLNIYSHLFPHKQHELLSVLENLGTDLSKK